MLYWDTSALLAVIFREAFGDQVIHALKKRGKLASFTSLITPIEAEAAISIRVNRLEITPIDGDRTCAQKSTSPGCKP